MANNFRAKFGYLRSFGTAAFQNELQYCHFNKKIFDGIHGNILATYPVAMPPPLLETRDPQSGGARTVLEPGAPSPAPSAKSWVRPCLNGVDGVIDTVDSEVVVWSDALARRRRERGDAQQLGRPRTSTCTRLTNHSEARRRVAHHVTPGRVHLHVDGGVESLLADRRHRLSTNTQLKSADPVAFLREGRGIDKGEGHAPGIWNDPDRPRL